MKFDAPDIIGGDQLAGARLIRLLEEGDSALAKAQDLVYRACETEDHDQRLKLAQEALAASPDCADAYVCVGEMLPAADDAMQWFL